MLSNIVVLIEYGRYRLFKHFFGSICWNLCAVGCIIYCFPVCRLPGIYIKTEQVDVFRIVRIIVTASAFSDIYQLHPDLIILRPDNGLFINIFL